MPEMESVLESVLRAMLHPSLSEAHARHVPALSRLVRLHAATGFSLSQVAQVSAVVRFAAGALERGVPEYAPVLADLCTLSAVPFARATVNDDRAYLADVAELLSALGSLLSSRAEVVATAVSAARAPARGPAAPPAARLRHLSGCAPSPRRVRRPPRRCSTLRSRARQRLPAARRRRLATAPRSARRPRSRPCACRTPPR